MSVRVYIPGVWDMIHVGHLAILRRAKQLGDVLIVGVPSDEVVKLDKGDLPVVPLHQRMEMLEALRCVDVVVPYYNLEFLTHIRWLQPKILAVGETWWDNHQQRHTDAEKLVRQIGGRVVTLPYTRGVSSSDIRLEAARRI